MGTTVWGSGWNGDRHRAGSWDPVWDQLLVFLLLSLTVVAAVVLATGHVAALVVNQGWPSFGTGDVPGILSRWLGSLGDPGAAWHPVNQGADVPGPTAWWTVFAVILAAIASGPLYLRVGRRRTPKAASWASSWRLRRLRVRRRAGRLIIGRQARRLLAVEARHSLLVLGPTQSGKTTGLAVPAILEWPGPVVATSTKGDLVQDTIGWRSRLGEVHVYDPAGATSYRCSGWSPLAGCSTWEGTTRAAWELAMAGKAAVGGGMNLAGFWFAGAAKALSPYLFAAARTGRSMGDVARWIDAEEREEVLNIVRGFHADAAGAHEATFRREDRARSSIFQVMQQIVGAYLEPAVSASADRSDIIPAELLDGGAHTLYLTAPHRDQDRFRALFSTVIAQVIDVAYRHHAETGKALDPPLLLVLDEAANIAPLEDLPTIASTAAASGLQVITVFQDLAQVRHRYGDRAGTVVNNHRAKLLLPGISDLDTLDQTSRLVGEEETDRDSFTTDAGGRRSATTATHWRRLLPAEMVRQLRDGEGVLLYGNLPPARLCLRPWFKDRTLRKRARSSMLELPPADLVAGHNLERSCERSSPPTPPPPAPAARSAEKSLARQRPTEDSSPVSVLEAARARRAKSGGAE